MVLVAGGEHWLLLICYFIVPHLFQRVKSDETFLISKGFIDKTPGSDHFGNFTVSASDLNLFAADTNIKQRLNEIKELATTANTDPTEENCDAVLDSLYSGK